MGGGVTLPLPVGADDLTTLLAGPAVAPLLVGFRGQPAADLAALTRLLVDLAALVTAHGDHIAELDLNPVIAHGDGVTIVDALIVTGPAPE